MTGLTEGTEYTVEVEAVDTNNNVSAKAAATFTTKKDAVNPDPTVVDKTELKATTAKADAALAASLFHYKELEISQVKDYLSDRGISVRR